MADIITALTTVWDAIFTWIVGAIPRIVPVFYTAGSGSTSGSLTFIGVLAIVALGISVFFLLMGLIQNFLHLRG